MLIQRGYHRRSTAKVATISLQVNDRMKQESFKQEICLAPTAKAQFMNLLLHNGVVSQDALSFPATYVHLLLHCIKMKEFAKYAA